MRLGRQEPLWPPGRQGRGGQQELKLRFSTCPPSGLRGTQPSSRAQRGAPDLSCTLGGELSWGQTSGLYPLTLMASERLNWPKIKDLINLVFSFKLSGTQSVPGLLIEKFMDGLRLKIKIHYPKSMLLYVVREDRKGQSRKKMSKAKLQKGLSITINKF